METQNGGGVGAEIGIRMNMLRHAEIFAAAQRLMEC
jgi:hypothetical protein